MRMLKCYLASDRVGQFVTAKDAMRSPGSAWTCVSCGCPLVLHAGMPGESPWFEHDQHTVATNVLMKCAHLDPQVKADVRLNQLRKAIGELDAHASVLSWYCAWCGSHYHGAKLCSACDTGIYSIEEVNWQANYA